MSESELKLCYLVPGPRAEQYTGYLGTIVDSVQLSENAFIHIVQGDSSDYFVVPATSPMPERRAAVGAGVGISAFNFSRENESFFWTNHESTLSNVEHALGVDQTNETVILDDRICLKWQLTAQSSIAATKEEILFTRRFVQTPKLQGHLWWLDSTGNKRLIASANSFIADSKDGWSWAPELLSTTDSTIWAHELGKVTAQMHSEFSTAGFDAIDDDDIALMETRTTNQLVGIAKSNSSALAVLQERADWVLSELKHLKGNVKQLIHGDFHVGQILRTTSDEIFVIDFEGDPLITVQFPLQTPLVDIASMRCSLLHASAVAVKQGADESLIVRQALEADRQFLSGYGEINSLTEREIDLSYLLMWSQEIRELNYAETFLPRWRYASEFAITKLQDGYGR